MQNASGMAVRVHVEKAVSVQRNVLLPGTRRNLWRKRGKMLHPRGEPDKEEKSPPDDDDDDDDDDEDDDDDDDEDEDEDDDDDDEDDDDDAGDDDGDDDDDGDGDDGDDGDYDFVRRLIEYLYGFMRFSVSNA